MSQLMVERKVRTLGDICNIIGGGTPSKEIKEFYKGDIAWATIRDMKEDVITQTECKITEEAVKNSSTNIIKAGNVVIATRVGLGKVCIVNQDTAINQDLRGIVPKRSGVPNKRYLFWWLKSIAHIIEEEGTGATVKGVKLPFVKSLEIPLPPLPEQKRIVAILDEAFAGISQAVANAEKNLANARELFESYLNGVFTQKGEGWVEERLDEVCLKIQDGAHHSPKKTYTTKTPNRFLYVTSKNIRNNYIDLSNIQYCDAKFHDTIYPRCDPEFGDVLLTKDGANTGNVTLNTINEPFSLLSSVCLLKTDPAQLIPSFLKYYIQSRKGFEHIAGQMTGTAIKRIILKTIKAATIPLPDLSLQKDLVKKMDKLLDQTRHLESIYQQKLTALSELKQSILQKAFTGELTRGSLK